MTPETTWSRPWSPDASRHAVRGRLTVKLRSGAAPDAIPAHRDVRMGLASAALRLDHGDVDRKVHRFSPAMRVSRKFRPARLIGGGRPAWSELEDRTGLSRTFRVEVDPGTPLLPLLHELRALDAVESATPQYLCATPFLDPDEALSDPVPPSYAQDMIRAGEALAVEPGDSTLIVAVVDSGCDLHHPELAGVLRPGLDTVDLPPDQVSRGLTLFGDTVLRDRFPVDDMGHGTACAGLIGARGLQIPRGIGGAARVLPMRALAAAHLAERSKPSAVGSIDDLDQALKAAVDLGAKVLNLSFGTPATALRPDDAIPHADVVQYAVERGCILVSASGNSGDASRYYPACLDGVIAVGSVGAGRRPSRFSSRGPHVALCAPGEQLYAASIRGGREHVTGTSFASPLVAGVCALLAATAARYSRPLPPRLAREILVATAAPFADNPVKDGVGAGILDAAAAVHALNHALHAAEAHSFPTPSAPATSQTRLGASCSRQPAL